MRGGDNSFERIYIQSGMNVKPFTVESVHKGEENDVREEESLGEKQAWKLLKDAIVTYYGNPVGTVAANDPGDKSPLNYDQVFIRDFIPSALAFLLKGDDEIVKNFLLHTLQLQSWEKTVDCYSPGQDLMLASFKVRTVAIDGDTHEEVLNPDFGESAIGRVAPIDSGLWWTILLRTYRKIKGDYSLQKRVDVQTGLKIILKPCLTSDFDMFPSLLVTDGSCMIDRRMGIHGHPLEIQVGHVGVSVHLILPSDSFTLPRPSEAICYSCLGLHPSIIGGFSRMCAFMGVAVTFVSSTLVKQFATKNRQHLKLAIESTGMLQPNRRMKLAMTLCVKLRVLML